MDTLPGIGPAIAGRIVEWRESNGGFRSIDELDEVSGVGPALMSDLRDRVTV
ncbi:ComEA family DNA-binding protein [Litorihabitans aurantiacus]|uniref:ComEA family DNA-binding protein n=1 Tax=Litorihabitans aurantiacus TaxID=1930061 RepID=UPI0024E12D41|nr:helix-hairpin-helix domain-containing protein [Litorihabitans aurantiacus]